jgi:hypothetical protein
MLKVSVLLFAIAALGGLTLAALHFKKKPLPFSLAILHGLMGALGLAALVMGVLAAGGPSGWVGLALVIFLVVAVGGFLLFSFHIRKRPLPSFLVVVHGLAAVVAFGMLVAGLWFLS